MSLLPRRLALLVSLATGLLCCAFAAVVAARSPAPVEPPPLPESMREEAFRYVAQFEAEMRDGTKNSYPGDAWSQDDQFYAGINFRVGEFAAQKNVSRSDVWRALDEGVRERWTVPDGGPPLKATIVPCRPRPIY